MPSTLVSRTQHALGLAAFLAWELLLANFRVGADVLRGGKGEDSMLGGGGGEIGPLAVGYGLLMALAALYLVAGLAIAFIGIIADRLISANTFSKSWLMTGWRLGWLVVPAGLSADLGKLIEYNTSCAPVFVQRAGIAALKDGEPVIERTRARFRAARDFLVGLFPTNRLSPVFACDQAGERATSGMRP